MGLSVPFTEPTTAGPSAVSSSCRGSLPRLLQPEGTKPSGARAPANLILVAEWIHFTLFGNFGIILPTIKLKVYTFWGLINSATK